MFKVFKLTNTKLTLRVKVTEEVLPSFLFPNRLAGSLSFLGSDLESKGALFCSGESIPLDVKKPTDENSKPTFALLAVSWARFC